LAVGEIKREVYEHLESHFLPPAIGDSMATCDALYKMEDFKEGQSEIRRK
jgi:hypothetical protein